MSRSVLIARPLWSVLRRIGAELSARGYAVRYSPSWNEILEGRAECAELLGLFLGEFGAAGEETEILRKFRRRDGGRGVPILLVGGGSALGKARRFREAGADLVLPADLSTTELLEQAQPLLAYRVMNRDLAAANRTLADLTMVDGLTGLPNRRRFSLELGRSVEMARRIGRPLSCIVTDIDDLRRVNETYGAPAGDGVIRQFGDVLSRTKRSYDTVARLGGDEFVWLLVGADAEQAARAAARAHRTVLESAFHGSDGPVRVTATWGVASVSPGGVWGAQTLVENADRALYWGKESGKNVVRCYPPPKAAGDA